MITITDQAVAKVKGIMEDQNRSDASLRVFVQGGGCAGFRYGMAFDDTIEETDKVLEFSGLKVLIDEMSSEYLEGAVVDYTESLEGSGFSITNPNVEASCGCGNSFKAKGGGCGSESAAQSQDQGSGGGCCGH